MPKAEVARPTVEAGMPRPPVKTHGRDCAAVSSRVDRGLERKSVHKFVNAPSWKSNSASVTRVNITFRVQTRLNGRDLIVRFSAGGVVSAGVFSTLSSIRGEPGRLRLSRL